MKKILLIALIFLITGTVIVRAQTTVISDYLLDIAAGEEANKQDEEAQKNQKQANENEDVAAEIQTDQGAVETETREQIDQTTESQESSDLLLPPEPSPSSEETPTPTPEEVPSAP